MSFSPFLAPERDDAIKIGRPLAAGETYYTIPGVQAIVVATEALVGGTDQYAPWYASSPLVIDQLAFEVTTLVAASNTRVGFYRANTNWQPIGAPLADSGDISTATTGAKTYTPASPIYVPRGRYLSVINSSHAPTLRLVRGSPETSINSTLGANLLLRNMDVTRAYAAFPTPGTAWDTEFVSATQVAQFVFYRVSAP